MRVSAEGCKRRLRFRNCITSISVTERPEGYCWAYVKKKDMGRVSLKGQSVPGNLQISGNLCPSRRHRQ